MTSAYRRSSAVVTRRAAVVERLRRVLFSPPKLIAVGALALAFAAGNAFGQEAVTGALEAKDYVVNGTLDLTGAYYGDTVQNYGDYSIDLNGGTLYLTTNTTAPMCDINLKTLFVPSLTNPQANETFDLESAQTLFALTHKSIWNQKLDLLPDVAPMPYSEWIKAIHGEEVWQKYATASLETIYANNEISQAVAFQGHYLDLSAGGTVNVANMPMGALNPDVDLYYGFLNNFGVNVSAQTINGNFTKVGDGVLTLHSYLNPETQQTVSTQFKDALNVYEGALVVVGDASYEKEVVVFDGRLTTMDGNQTFNSDVMVLEGVVDIQSQDKNQKRFLSDVTIMDGSQWWSYGNVEYQGDVVVFGYDKPTQAVFSNQLEYNGKVASENPASWGKTVVTTTTDGQEISEHIPSALNIIGGDGVNNMGSASVFANANSINADLMLSGQSYLYYLNVDKQAKDRGINNTFFITLDENQTPTTLEWTSGRTNIQNAQEQQNIVRQNITSIDEQSQIFISTMGDQIVDQTGVANGYTVVFNNNDGKSFDFAGQTLVDKGFMVVQGDTNFGSSNLLGGTSVFQVIGEAYTKYANETFTDDKGNISVKNKWLVDGCGMLGFDRNGAATAPSITADIVMFRNGLQWYDSTQIGGSRIWINAEQSGELGAINAKTLIFGDKTEIWYDGISTRTPEEKMTFALNAETIKYGDTAKLTSNGVNLLLGEQFTEAVQNLGVTTVGDIEDLFGAAVLVDATYAPAAAPVDATDLTEAQRRAQLATAGTVTVSAKNVGDYAAEQGMSGKEQELAQKLDGARVDGGQSSARFYDALYNETDGGKVRQTIHNLSLLGYTMLNSQGHFGNPTSSFFGGASLSGEAKRGQELDPNVIDPQPEPSAIAKQVYNPKQSVWAAYTHTSVDGDDYDFGGVTMHGYKLRRDGIIGGIRRQADATTSAGLFFGLSTPEVESRNALNAYGQIAGNGYGTVGSKMEMTDFQFAGHVDKVLADVWELSLYAGGGTQAMEWERDANLTNGGYYKYEADGSGNTLTGTIYLAYRANVNDSLVLRPTIGVDSEHSWLYGFAETATVEGQGGADNVLLDPYTDMFAQAYAYKKTYYNRNTARAGLSFAYSDPRNDLMGLNGRVFYGVKLGGDDAPELSYYSANYQWDNMESHEMGDSSLNVGGGGFMHLNALKTLTATGDVNAIWYKNAQTFNVTGGVNYRF